MHRVNTVEYLDDYRLKLYFDNGRVKIIDLADELKSAKNKFRDLKDIDYFKKVKCDGISIIWPNEIDFCPDWLYMNGKGVELSVSHRKRATKKIKRKKLQLFGLMKGTVKIVGDIKAPIDEPWNAQS